MPSTPPPDDLRGALAVAVDDSPSAREALRFAAGLAERLGRTLHVVHVWSFVSGDAPEQSQDVPPTLESWQAEAERNLAALVEQELPGADVRQVVLHGSTVPVLLSVSELVDQLVVGTRGRGGFSGLLLGSTSAQLVGHAHCPVTVVRHGSTS